MESNQPTNPVATTNPVAAATTTVFQTKIPSTISFLIGSLLFLLPFSEIKCGGSTIATKSGLSFALNKEWKTSGGSMFGNDASTEKSMQEGDIKKGNTQYFIIAAFVLAIIGLLISYRGSKGAGSGGLFTAVLSAAALIGFMIDLKYNFSASLKEKELGKIKNGANDLGFDKIGNTMNDLQPVLGFTPWFYLTIIALLAACFFSYKRMQSEKS
jgi:hypothetical protein